MDGVLFDSMPYHSEAWHKVMKSHGLTLSREEAYMHEGRTGASTIHIVFQRELGREATQEAIESIYQEKSVLFNSYPEAKPMPGAWELLQKVKKDEMCIRDRLYLAVICLNPYTALSLASGVVTFSL